MQISLNAFESTLLNLDSQSLHQIDGFMRIKDDGSVTWTNNRVTVGVVQTGDLPGWDGITGHQVGSNGEVNVLRQSGGDAPDVHRDTPDIRDDALFDSGGFVACLGNTSSTSLVCLTPQELIKVDPTLAIDPETGNPYSDQYGTEYAKRDIFDIFKRFLGVGVRILSRMQIEEVSPFVSALLTTTATMVRIFSPRTPMQGTMLLLMHIIARILRRRTILMTLL